MVARVNVKEIALPRAIQKIKHSALSLDANIALGFASCYISHHISVVARDIDEVLTYRIAGKFGGEKVRRIDSLRAFGERKFGELIDQPIGY